MKSLLLAFLLLSFQTLFGQITDVKTSNGRVEFDYISENTKGTLSKVVANVYINMENLKSSTIKGSAAVKTLNTGNKMRDKHLKSEDFFNEPNYPDINFNCLSLTKVNEEFMALGNLTIKDTTKDVEFHVELKEKEINFTCEIYAADFDVAVKKDREKSKVKIVVFIPITE